MHVYFTDIIPQCTIFYLHYSDYVNTVMSQFYKLFLCYARLDVPVVYLQPDTAQKPAVNNLNKVRGQVRA